MKSKNKFSLRQYSGMAGVLLLLHNNSTGQVVYTDIDPDIVLQFDGESAGVDMDNDGEFDFAFLKSSHYWTDSLYSDYEFRHILWCGPYGDSGNEIAGDYATHGAGGGTTYFPYAILFGDLINETMSFQYAGYQLMGVGFYKIDGSLWTWHYDIGRWNPNIDSAHLGVKFKDIEECIHYGWIRCSTVDSAKTLIIHDYAYELKCETGVFAGDTIGDTTTTIGSIPVLDADVYTYDKNIFIRMENFYNKTIAIYDIEGKIIVSEPLSKQLTSIDFSKRMTGVYFVEISDGVKRIVKQLVIN